jgi:hypothetical protein
MKFLLYQCENFKISTQLEGWEWGDISKVLAIQQGTAHNFSLFGEKL